MSNNILSFLEKDSSKTIKYLLNSQSSDENEYDDGLFLPTGQKAVGVDLKDDKLKAGSEDITTDKIIEGDNKFLSPAYVQKIEDIPTNIDQAFIKNADTLDSITEGTTNKHFTLTLETKLGTIAENADVTPSTVFLKDSDTLDNIFETGIKKTVTANEKIGAGRAYSSLDENNHLTTGIVDTVSGHKFAAKDIVTQIEKVVDSLDADGYNIIGVSDGVKSKSSKDLMYEVDDSFKISTNSLDAIDDGSNYGKMKLDGLHLGYPKTSMLSQEADYKLVSDNEKTGAGRAYAGFDENNNLITGIRDTVSGNNFTAEDIVTQVRKVVDSLDTDGYNVIGVSDGVASKSSADLILEVNDSFKLPKHNLDNINDGSNYGKVKLDGLSSGYPKTSMLSQDSNYKLVSDNEKAGAGRAYAGLDDNGYVIVGLKSGETSESSANLLKKTSKLLTTAGSEGTLSASDVNEVSSGETTKMFVTTNEKTGASRAFTNINEDGYLTSGLESTSGETITAEELVEIKNTNITNNAGNLITNPFFENGTVGWYNAVDGVVPSVVEYDGIELEADSVTYSSVNIDYTIVCPEFPFSSFPNYGFGIAPIYIQFTGSPTSALENVKCKIKSIDSGTNSIVISVYESFGSISQNEKFKIIMRGLYSRYALKLLDSNMASGVPIVNKPIKIPVVGLNTLKLDFLMEYAFGKNYETTRGIDIIINIYDEFMELIDTFDLSESTIYLITPEDLDYPAFRVFSENLPDIVINGGHKYIYAEIAIYNNSVSETDSAYISALALGVDLKDFPLYDNTMRSGEFDTFLNETFNNNSAIKNIKDGKKPDGKFISPKQNYSALVVTMDINKAVSETGFAISESDIRDEIGNNIDLHTDDRILDAIMQVKIDKGSDMFDIVDSTKDISVKYSTYNKVTVLNKIVVANCPTTEEDYRVTFTCNLQNCPS